MLLIYQNMLIFLKNTKICTYMPKISKKKHIYPMSGNKSFDLALSPLFSRSSPGEKRSKLSSIISTIFKILLSGKKFSG